MTLKGFKKCCISSGTANMLCINIELAGNVGDECEESEGNVYTGCFTTLGHNCRR